MGAVMDSISEEIYYEQMALTKSKRGAGAGFSCGFEQNNYNLILHVEIMGPIVQVLQRLLDSMDAR